MIPVPPPVFTTRWRDTDLSVFAADRRSPLTLAEAGGVLSGEERERAGRFHFEADRERWIRSRALLRMGLGSWLGVAAESLIFATGPQGKLSLPSCPGCHFNLSHSGDLMALAMGTGPMGIDIERMQEDLSFDSLAAYAFLPGEAAAITAHFTPSLLFYRLWTAKEAVMKCTGLGMSLPPLEIAITLDGETGGSAVRTDDGGRFSLLSLLLPEGYALGAAVYGP